MTCPLEYASRASYLFREKLQFRLRQYILALRIASVFMHGAFAKQTLFDIKCFKDHAESASEICGALTPLEDLAA